MASRNRDTGKERQWRRWIEEQISSGVSIRAYCSSRGLAEASFYHWRRILAERHCQPGSNAALFVPVEIDTPVLDRRLEIVLVGGRRVQVPPDFDDVTLTRVLAVLEARSC